MDIHERNNHLECNMNNEGTRSHYKCPTHPLCSPLTPSAPSPAAPIHYFALDYLCRLSASRGNEIAVSHPPACWPERSQAGDLGTNKGSIETVTVGS